MKSYVAISLSLSALLLATACGPSPTPTTQKPEPQKTEPAESPEPSNRTFAVRGVIKDIPETGTQIRIDHEEIPEYMPAMTMPFNIKDRLELDGFQVGDTIAFKLHVTDRESWIDEIEAASTTPQPAPGELPSMSSFRRVRDVEPLEVGDVLPNYPFTNQYGKPVTLDQFRDQVLVLTFIYTRCPLPDFCPRMSMHYRTAYEALTKDPDGPSNFHFLSITFDPKFDTPEMLLNYSKAYSYDPKKWSFLTGEMIEIDAITEQFGLVFSRTQGSTFEWDHNLRTVVVDPHGIIHKIFIGNTWQPKDLIFDMKQAAKAAPPAQPATAPSSEEPDNDSPPA